MVSDLLLQMKFRGGNEMTNISPTKRLAEWFEMHCDGDWEHSYGVAIDTLDNPGWSLRVDLTDTELAGLEFLLVKEERSEHDWIHCRVDSSVFMGAGGIHNLDELITCFLEWSAMAGKENFKKSGEIE